MEVHFNPELEAKLTHSAAQQGRDPEELAQEILARYFEEEIRFVEAVKRGEAALQGGKYITHDQVASVCGASCSLETNSLVFTGSGRHGAHLRKDRARQPGSSERRGANHFRWM